MTLAVYNSAAFKAESGLALAPNATVEVRRESDSGLAGLFSDEAGTIGITNPSAFADSEGRFAFYVAASVGGYSIQVTSGAETYTLNNVAIGTAAQYDVGSFSQLPLDAAFDTLNLTLAASVGSSALTVALKTQDGTDPSATSPVHIKFRHSTIGDGTYETVEVNAAASIVASSGSTLGTVSAQAHRLYVIGVNDGGTFRLALWNPWDDTNTALAGILEDNLYSATAEGGAGAADSAHVLYAGSAVTTKAVRILGYIESTQATAGTWATTPSKISVMQPGMSKTGDVIQDIEDIQTGFQTGSTLTPIDDTIPAITEGKEFQTQAITPTNAINLLEVISKATIGTDTASRWLIVALHQDAITDALAADANHLGGNGIVHTFIIDHRMIAASASTITFRMRAGPSASATITWNGVSAASLFSTSGYASLRVKEIFR